MDKLVSVYVITYNSSEFILETLESIKKQTYDNIELIISDDHSGDNTISLCKEWLKSNENRFVNSLLLESPSNTGVSANCNRAVKASSGEWLKCIAGDDRLLPNCIKSNLDFVNKHENVDLLFTKVVPFGNLKAANKWPFRDCSSFLKQLSLSQIFILMCQGYNFLPAPAAFFRRSVYDKVGGFEESIPFMEDRPFWIKALFHGVNIHFNPVETVEYRFSNKSMSQIGVQTDVKNRFRDSYNKADQFGFTYLKRKSIFAYFYCMTTFDTVNTVAIWRKILHSLNVLNPFYYENIKAHRIYNCLCKMELDKN